MAFSSTTHWSAYDVQNSLSYWCVWPYLRSVLTVANECLVSICAMQLKVPAKMTYKVPALATTM